MKKITLFDTSICTENIGDKIIMDSANREIKSIFPDSFYVNIPTHDIIGRNSYRHISSSNYTITCGTNMLTANMLKYKQWKIRLLDTFFVNDVVLLGVGWWQYQNKPDRYTSLLLKRALSKDKIHSVRDNYTKEMLNSIGINNVINTSCPTMWSLTPEHCADIPAKKAKNVIITLTDYNKDPERDKSLLQTVKRNYENVYFWIQAWDDYNYLKDTLKENEINLVPPTLEALDEILSSDMELDYIGTRLHAGIRALQFKRRSIIIGIDNRALEKAKDFNLTVVERQNIQELEGLLLSDLETKINIPIENINKWKSQFNN